MAETTGISWAHATWNPFYGCKKVSAGCAKCYAERDMEHYGRNFNVVTRASDKTFYNPVTWARSGKLHRGARIFTCSWSDWFIKEADAWRDKAWSVIKQTPQFTYMILTKRPERIMEHLPADWGDGWDNVWLGVSTENQEQADKRLPFLLNVPTKVRWISAEPLLGPINFERFLYHRGVSTAGPWIDALGRKRGGSGMGGQAMSAIPSNDFHWMITGGESDDKDPRPCDPDWVRSIRDQCREVGVAFHHKQWGGSKKVDGSWGGRVLDGMIWNEFPA